MYSFCRGSLIGTKISCQLKAYGLSRNFLSFWCCTDEEEKILAVISRFEDSVSLLMSDKSVADDIRAFLDMISFGSLCCSRDTAEILGYRNTITKRAYIYKGLYTDDIIPGLWDESYKECYSLISRAIPDSFSDTDEAYLNFLSDFTYRSRRGLARMKGCTENERVLSCAMTSAETDSAAIISGVACDIKVRKKGLGRRTVLSLAEELHREGKEVYVIALNEDAEGFYERIGFEPFEKISFIERK